MLGINELLSVFQDKDTLEIFNQIVKNKKIRLKDLVRQIHGTTITQEKAKHSLNVLERAGLVTKKGVETGIYTIYYVTADGLQASRKIRLITTW